MDSFNTISSEESGRTNNILLTPPSSATHDTSRSTYHISDIAAFAESLQDAANQAFPNRESSRYHTVNVCLIRWEEDELQVEYEVDQLYHVFDKFYGFNTEIWLIPSSASQIQLTRKTCDFLQKFDAEGNLFILYYGGHGKINSARQNQWWCKADPSSPVVDWTSIQTLFVTAASDVLILLDCCAAASSASGFRSGTMETIAACGFETTAPSPGEYSFTYTLIEVLEEWVDKPSFSAAMLHTEILFVLKQKRPERGVDGRRWESCSTPIHWVCTGDPKAPGIEIASLRGSNAAGKRVEDEHQPRSTTFVDAMELDDETSSQNPLLATQPNGNYKIPHVLISIALEEDQETLDALACRRWLLDFPALAKYATVEGVYRGFSTLITLSLPVMVWDLLPNHPACSFIGYIVSPNKNKQPLSIETELLLLSKAKSISASSAQFPSDIFGIRSAEFQALHRGPSTYHRRQIRPSKLKSCDSSYGSDGSESDSERDMLRAGTLEGWEIRSSDADDDDSEWEDTFSKVSAENATFGEASTKPIDIQMKGPPIWRRYRSPDQVALSERSLITTGLSESLRLKQGLVSRQNRLPLRIFGAEEEGMVRRKRSNSI